MLEKDWVEVFEWMPQTKVTVTLLLSVLMVSDFFIDMHKASK